MNHLQLKLIAAAVAILIVGIAGGYWFAQQRLQSAAPRPRSGRPQILYWHDPMVPSPRFDKPGKSPFMDMQLVPVYADEARQRSGQGQRDRDAEPRHPARYGREGELSAEARGSRQRRVRRALARSSCRRASRAMSRACT